MFTRLLEKELVRLLRHFPAVALLGARQVGKTTLARTLLKKFRKSVYLDMEDVDDHRALSNPRLFFDSYRDHLIVIDEIQRTPELFPALRSEIDRQRKPGRYLLLGSASPDLLQKSSETLAGRIVYKELSPLLLSEVSAKIDYRTHWLRGGFPDAIRQRTAALWNVWHSAFLRTYVERDLPMLGLPTPSHTLTRLLQMIAYNHGQILNKSEYAHALGVSVPTVSQMLDYLMHAYLIRLLPPYANSPKKRIVRSPKLYVRDSGMLHHLLGITHHKNLLNNPKVGYSWEGYVIEQIIQHAGAEKNYFYYRTQDGAGCDLVIAHYNKPQTVVEIKLNPSAPVMKGLRNSMEDLRIKKAFVVVPGTDVHYAIDRRIQVVSLSIWLEKYTR
ncbi:MAG: ATP-binding protein [Chitinophagales bacterium]|nr:ATP-binding protein [Chitinophagales bacterium]